MKNVKKLVALGTLCGTIGVNLALADDFIIYPQNNFGNNAFAPRGFMQNSEETKMFYGNILQMATLHIGADFLTSRINNNLLGVDNKKVAMDLGVSVGWNYFEAEDEEIDFGLRLKYLYTKSDYKTHSVGLVGYLHPYTYPIIYNSPVIQPLSFLVGGGYTTTKAPNGISLNGGYVEAGIALFKYFPLNLDIIYRASFYGKKSGIGANTTHSVSLMFNIL